MARFEIKIDCGDEKTAGIINASIKIDNDRHISSYVEGKYIIASGEEDNLMSILNTINDFLSCLSLSKEIVDGNDI